MNSQKCYLCKESKPLVKFHKNKTKPNGHQTECINCRKKYASSYYAGKYASDENYRNKVKENNTRWRKANPKKHRTNTRKWQKANPEKQKASNLKRRTSKYTVEEILEQWLRKEK